MDYKSKEIWLINLPVMMSILIEQLINITDAIFLGHVGEVELGAAAIAGIWYLAVYMLGFGFSTGLQVVIARRNGEGRHAETGRAFCQGLLFLTALAALLCLLSKLFSPWIMGRLIASDEVCRAVVAYLDWRVYGLLFSFPFLALRSLLVGITQTKALNRAALTAVVVNIPANWLLIFTFGMGIGGAALTSSLAEMCSLAVLTAHVWRTTDHRRYGLRWQFDTAVLRHVVRVSVWTMLNSFVGVVSWLAFFIAIEHLGSTELAATNVLRSVSALFFVIVSSLATTTGSLASNLIGAGESQKVTPLCRRTLRLGYTVGLPLIALALLLYHPIMSIYTDSEAIAEVARWPFAVMLANYIFALPGYVYLNAVTGTGATRTTFLLQLVTIAVYQLYLWAVSHHSTSLSAYWTAEYIYVISLGLLSVMYLKRKHYRP